LKIEVKYKVWADVGVMINSLIKMCVNVGGYRRENVTSESQCRSRRVTDGFSI
jgi:hypothetical protein